MDGQKVLREEVQLQQGSLMRLTSRVEARVSFSAIGVNTAYCVNFVAVMK